MLKDMDGDTPRKESDDETIIYKVDNEFPVVLDDREFEEEYKVGEE